MFYNLLQRQITRKAKFTKAEAEDLQNKFDVFFLAERITQEEYQTLTNDLKAKTEEMA